MARVCEICGKGPMTGHNVSHANNKTNRRWYPNLQRVRAVVNGTTRRLRVCTRCLKSNRVTNAAYRKGGPWGPLAAAAAASVRRSRTQQFDPSHLGAVARAMAQLDDAGVAPGPRREPRPHVLEELVRHVAILEAALHQATRVQVAAPRQGDEALGVGPELFRLRLGGDDPVVAEQARGEVRQQRLLVARRARELASLGAMAHYFASPSLTCACGAAPASTTFSSSSVSSNFIPKLSPSRRNSSAISPSAFSPTFFTFSRSSSRYCTKSPRVRMLEFLSELTERTESPTSSIERASTSRSRLVAAPPPFPAGCAATIGTLPKSTKNRKCSCASAAAYATASSGEMVPLVSTVSVSRS